MPARQYDDFRRMSCVHVDYLRGSLKSRPMCVVALPSSSTKVKGRSRSWLLFTGAARLVVQSTSFVHKKRSLHSYQLPASGPNTIQRRKNRAAHSIFGISQFICYFLLNQREKLQKPVATPECHAQPKKKNPFSEYRKK